MAVELKYDKVQYIEIGYDNTHKIQIYNVVSFADRVVSPDGDMLYPFKFINHFSPPGVHHNHKYWELEMVLDSQYATDTTTDPIEYWQYYLDVQAAGGPQYPIVCDDEWNYIEWFKVYIREADGTQTCLTYAAEDPNVLWCVSELSELNNEIGTRHQTVTFKFICFKERVRTYTHQNRTPGLAGYANEGPIKYLRVDAVSIGAPNFITNILRYSDEFVTNMTPQFMPNVFPGLDMKQDQHWRILSVVLDSESDLFDGFFIVTTANPNFPINNLDVFITIADGAGTIEGWQYTGGANRILYGINRLHGRYDDDVERDTIEYQFFSVCDKTFDIVP